MPIAVFMLQTVDVIQYVYNYFSLIFVTLSLFWYVYVIIDHISCNIPSHYVAFYCYYQHIFQ